MDTASKRVSIKRTAKLNMRGHYARAIAIMLIVILITGGIGAICNRTTAVVGGDDYRVTYDFANGETTFRFAGREISSDVLADGIDTFINNYQTVGVLDFSSITNVFTIPNGTFFGLFPNIFIPLILLIFSLLSLIINIPLQYGEFGWYVALSRGDARTVGSLFDWFADLKNLLRAIGTEISLYFRKLLYADIIPAIPSVLTCIAAGICYEQNVGIGVVAIILASGMLLSFIAYIIMAFFTLRYAAAQYNLIREPQNGVNASIRDSIKYMNGHRWEYFVFILSFLGWFLLVIPTCGIFLFWLMPYYTTAKAGFFEYVREDWENKNLPKTDFNPNDSGVENFNGFNGPELI